MHENTGFSGSQVLLAFVGGAAAGAVVALLTAPQSGAKTRAMLRDRAIQSGESAARFPTALQGAIGAASDAFGNSLTKGLDNQA